MTDKPTQSPELEALDPTPETRTLSTGVVVEYEKLKTIQFFALTRIISRGSSELFGAVKLNPNASRAEFTVQFVALLAAAIPEADAETLEFLKSMTRPAGLVTGPDAGKGRGKVLNEELWRDYDASMANPELEDTFGLIEDIVRRESEDVQSLGKRLLSMLRMARKAGKIPQGVFSDDSSETTQTSSSEASPEPST